MSDEAALNPASLEPLYSPWEEPNAHRLRAEKAGEPARRVEGRRPSKIEIAKNLRGALRDWRESFYAGASDTTRQLLDYWFERPHRSVTAAGEEFEFRYYFCQREAIEAFIYLREVRGLKCLSQVTAEFGGADREIAALGITEEEDAWARYAFKLATGAGKTKVMSLAIAWSYFHALRESESQMAKHFVMIAPTLTVYERLKEDFEHGKIFDTDPLIPVEWKGDWNLSVVLQDAASGAATGGVLYLTNIHRLYDPKKRKGKDSDTYDWMGPAVSKSTALDTGKALRDRITSHETVMVLNDEAHHVWDPDSAWNEAITYLHETIQARSGRGLAAQLDFSATPKDNSARLFKHIVCDAPLGEAVDAGIVKTPVIGLSSKKLAEEASDDAAYIYDTHLRLGYERWKRSFEEWKNSGKKALLFVMCKDTEAADQITRRLNTDEVFKELNGHTLNLHTNLKGKLKKIGKGKDARVEFVENDKEISDEDLLALRKLSRELDDNSSQYLCIVSVLMLREGWDVRNVTTIVPLRPYSSKADILPEQTLGRGLRRMTPPGQANEVVVVVDHPAFKGFYERELADEGLPIETTDLDKVPVTTVSIFVDERNKDVAALDIELPALRAGHYTVASVEGLTIEDVKKESAKHQKLPLGEKGTEELKYEGRHLFTDEVVESMKIHLPLLKSGFGAISYYVKQLEHICRTRNLHQAIAPLLQTFFEEILFERKTSLTAEECVSRLSALDVREHVSAVFVPLILARITKTQTRAAMGEGKRLSTWKPFAASHSERHPVRPAARTIFNLVPCNRTLEEGFAGFADVAKDVAAFAKNAGPQCLRIDYVGRGGRLGFYTPDFFVRMMDGKHYLVETKGREDRDVPIKARAAMAWCASASTPERKWEYLYIPQGVFEELRSDTLEELVRSCAPALQQLIQSIEEEEQVPLLAWSAERAEEAAQEAKTGLVDAAVLETLPERYRKAIEQATDLYRYYENKPNVQFGPVFQALLGSLDDAVNQLIARRMDGRMPSGVNEQKAWFAPYLERLQPNDARYYNGIAQNLMKTLVFGNGLSLIGLLASCMDYALNDNRKIGGVFDAVKEGFRFEGGRKLLERVQAINDFRNTYVAHGEKELTDAGVAKTNLVAWIEGLAAVSKV